ncbi:hypothetical protein D3C87_2035980 [compost metagenome]
MTTTGGAAAMPGLGRIESGIGTGATFCGTMAATSTGSISAAGAAAGVVTMGVRAGGVAATSVCAVPPPVM